MLDKDRIHSFARIRHGMYFYSALFKAMQYMHKGTYLSKCIDLNERKEMGKVLFNAHNGINLSFANLVYRGSSRKFLSRNIS